MIKWKNEFTYLIIIGLVGLVSVSYGLWNIKDCYEQNNGRAYLIIFTGIYLLLLTREEYENEIILQVVFFIFYHFRPDIIKIIATSMICV